MLNNQKYSVNSMVFYVEPNQEKITEQKDLDRIIKNIINRLDPIEQKVIMLRYFIPRTSDPTLKSVNINLQSGIERSFGEIGKALNIDSGKANRLLTSALRKIRHSKQAYLFKDYVTSDALANRYNADITKYIFY